MFQHTSRFEISLAPQIVWSSPPPEKLCLQRQSVGKTTWRDCRVLCAFYPFIVLARPPVPKGAQLKKCLLMYFLTIASFFGIWCYWHLTTLIVPLGFWMQAFSRPQVQLGLNLCSWQSLRSWQSLQLAPKSAPVALKLSSPFPFSRRGCPPRAEHPL